MPYRHTKDTRENEPQMDMSSMIDVSFLLLIYFIVTSTLDPKEADLGMRLPGIPPGPGIPVEVDPFPIRLNSLGHILIMDEVLDTDPNNRDVPKLRDRLTTYAQSARLTRSKPLVTIEADDAAKSQRFVDVLNALAHKTVDIRDVTLVDFPGDN